jgi:mgtE-like transporter
MTDEWSVRSITRSLLPVLLVLTALELLGGLTLGSFEATLLQYPALLVLVPVVIGTAGNLGSILSARLSTAFHLGVLSLEPADETLLGNAITTVLLALSVFPVVGVGGWVMVALIREPRLSVWMVLSVAVTSGLVLALLAIVVTFGTVYVAYQLELDPDNVVIPVVTNVCDILGVLVLFGVTRLLVG